MKSTCLTNLHSRMLFPLPLWYQGLLVFSLPVSWWSCHYMCCPLDWCGHRPSGADAAVTLVLLRHVYNANSPALYKSLASVGCTILHYIHVCWPCWVFDCFQCLSPDSAQQTPRSVPHWSSEVSCRLIGKAVINIVKPDSLGSVAGRQFFPGLESGCDTAVHCRTTIYHNTEASLLWTPPIPIHEWRNHFFIFSREGITHGDPFGMAM